MIETLNQIMEDGFQRKLVHNFISSEVDLPNSSIMIDDNQMVNFGSCSYLGLEKHVSLKNAVIDSVLKYGTQFSSSRTYLSHSLYQELEKLLFQIFKRPVIATASTTLGHLATIPVVIEKNDAIILDHQVHSSIQMTVQQLKTKNNSVHIIKHNCMKSLDSKIKYLYNKHHKIWYFADGVYSMFGDYAPFRDLDRFLNQYDKFHLYIDDAHGVGWTGEKGNGVVCKHLANKEKVILSVSLNKSFAAAGGAIVFPNVELERKVRNCGPTYIFSGPIQPPMLGAAVASAKLHLSDDIKSMQERLAKLIRFTNNKMDELKLPQFQKTDSPLFFIPVGLPKICYDMISKMKAKGFFLNTACFPAVPMRKSGIRLMINTFLNQEQIDEMLTALVDVYSETICENELSYTKISKTFNIPVFELNTVSKPKNRSKSDLRVAIYRSIQSLDKTIWNEKFINNGTLSYSNLKLIEKVFTNLDAPEDNWDFYYLVVKDDSDEIVLKTIITVALTKDDMFSEAYVSEKVERERSKNNPYYLTSKTVLTGSLVSKGNHVYINYEHSHWKKALSILTGHLNNLLDATKATKIMIRDFYGTHNSALETEMLERGFVKYKLPNNMIVESFGWKNIDEFLTSLSQKYRYNVKKEILAYESHFTTEFKKLNGEDEIRAVYKLYEQVFEKSYELNVFKLPFKYIKKICASKEFDIVRLYLKNPETVQKTEDPILVGVMLSQVTNNNYNAMIVGLDYKYVYKYNCYKQILFQTLLRAKELNCNKLDLSFTAELVKKKLGARSVPTWAFVQSNEHVKESMLTFV